MLQDVNNGDCNEDGTVRDSRSLQRYCLTFEVIWKVVLCRWANGPCVSKDYRPLRRR
jgi:hypothetical protein